MKLKKKYYSQQVAGSYFVMCADEKDQGEMLQLNEVGMDILKLLENEMTEETIISELVKVYDAQETQIREDVKQFLKQLVAKDMLV